MSKAFRLFVPLSLGLLLGACQFRRALTNEKMPLGDWVVVGVQMDRGRDPEHSLRPFGTVFSFQENRMLFQDAQGTETCATGYSLYERWVRYEDAFDPGDPAAFDAAEAGIQDKDIYEVRTFCPLKLYLRHDKKRLYIPDGKVLLILERSEDRLPTPTPEPTPEPKRSPTPSVPKLPMGRQKYKVLD